ncbi:MAG: HAD family hydrolase [Acidilobus sp.]
MSAVSFDVWGTLLDLRAAREAVIEAISSTTGAPKDKVRSAVAEADREVRRLRSTRGLSGLESVRLSLQIVASRLGYDGDLLSVANEAVTSLEPERVVLSDAVTSAREVSSSGLRIGVLGNTLLWAGSATRALLTRAFGNVFSFVGFADEIGFSKPDPRAFELTASSLNVDISELAHVGDRASEDLGGALASGARAVLVARGKVREVIVLPELGFAVIPDLTHLLSVLRKL